MSVFKSKGWRRATQSESKLISSLQVDWAHILAPKKKVNPLLKVLCFWKKRELSEVTFTFPKVCMVSPKLLANDIVSVQPMEAPSNFYVGYLYGSVFRIEKPTKEKIIGKTPEEYLINLVHAWNRLYSNFTDENVIEYYQYKIKCLVKVYPKILLEYEMEDYEKNLKLLLEDYKFEHKFVGYQPKPFNIESLTNRTSYKLW